MRVYLVEFRNELKRGRWRTIEQRRNQPVAFKSKKLATRRKNAVERMNPGLEARVVQFVRIKEIPFRGSVLRVVDFQ